MTFQIGLSLLYFRSPFTIPTVLVMHGATLMSVPMYYCYVVLLLCKYEHNTDFRWWCSAVVVLPRRHQLHGEAEELRKKTAHK